MMPEVSGAILLTLRIALAGCWWAGSVNGWLSRLAAITATGMVLNLFPAVALAPWNLWTPVADWLTWGGLVMLGAIVAFRRGESMSDLIRGGTAAAFLLMIMNVTISLLPARSEWVVGGWDPGLYQNMAVAVSTHNGLAPDTNSIYAAMTKEERMLVSFTEGTYREVLPGVPVDINTGALPRYFFHLTTLTGGWLFRLGGDGLLFRMPVLLAFMGVPVFLWLMLILGLKGWTLVAAGIFWCTSPVWWYQQAIPTTEMLYLFLMVSGLAFYLKSNQEDKPWPFMSGWLLFLATINHFNVPVLAGIFMIVFSMIEVHQGKRATATRLALLFTFILLGVAWDFAFSWITLARLEAKDAAIRAVLVPFFFCSIMAFLVASTKPRWVVLAPWLSWLRRATGLLAVGIVFALLLTWFSALRDALMDLLPTGNLLRGFLYRSSLLGSFLHPGALVLAAAGLFNLARREVDGWRPSILLLIVAGGLMGLFLAAPGIAPIYPWGLRRFVPALLPFMAVAQSGIVTGWAGGSRLFRGVALLLLLTGLTGSLVNSRDALRVGDYRGVHAVLERLISNIDIKDIVLVDDHRFATPLLLRHGHSVLLDRIIHEPIDLDSRELFRAMLLRVSGERGGRLLWLTTSGNPPREDTITHAERLFEEQAAYPLVVHSLRGNHFRVEIEETTLQLYVFSALVGDP